MSECASEHFLQAELDNVPRLAFSSRNLMRLEKIAFIGD